MKLNVADFANLSLLDMPAILRAKVEQATLVTTDEVSPGIVTMHSEVRLVDAATGQCTEIVLVYPAQADAAAGRVSVCEDLGMALLGAAVSDIVEQPSAQGPRGLRIEAVLYRPEHWMRINLVVRD
jgi:regulator of nucleoside diphosphate kinase